MQALSSYEGQQSLLSRGLQQKCTFSSSTLGLKRAYENKSFKGRFYVPQGSKNEKTLLNEVEFKKVNELASMNGNYSHNKDHNAGKKGVQSTEVKLLPSLSAKKEISPVNGNGSKSSVAVKEEHIQPISKVAEVRDLVEAEEVRGRHGQGSNEAKKRLTSTSNGERPSNSGHSFNKTLVFIQRTFKIWWFAARFAVKYFLLGQRWTYGRAGMTPDTTSVRKKSLARWLVDGLVQLGPTFIKVGQQFSTRVDVLAPEFIKELEKLQDNVPPFDNVAAREILEESLGAKVEDMFEEFDPEPIAAASLGQVYLARSRGEQVVVKVQRPGLKELFDVDLQNIRILAIALQKLDPKADGAARDWVAIYDECSRILYHEIDYRQEGRNADEFRTNFEGCDWVKVPRVHWSLSSRVVLVLEYVPGVKVNDAVAIDALGLDRQRLARLLVESYLQQLLRHGFFHADPHPGNVSVDAVGGGRLLYYDFGMMGRIPANVKDGLRDLFYGVYNKDPDKCLEALTVMGVYVPAGDKIAVRRTAEFFLRNFQERLDAQQKEREKLGEEYNRSFKAQKTEAEKQAQRQQILANIGEDLLLAANDQPFRFPAAFTFVVRSFTVLDGIGKTLDPRFDITEISAPYARQFLLEGSSPLLARVSKDLGRRIKQQNRAVVNLFKAPNYIEDIATTIRSLERGDLKLRVRSLEAERALARVAAMQKLTAAAVAASALVNVGTVLSVSAFAKGAAASFLGAALFALLVIKSFIQVLTLERKERQIAGLA